MKSQQNQPKSSVAHVQDAEMKHVKFSTIIGTGGVASLAKCIMYITFKAYFAATYPPKE
jgi:hypothetical protein